jgi:hypothetical protein
LLAVAATISFHLGGFRLDDLWFSIPIMAAGAALQVPSLFTQVLGRGGLWAAALLMTAWGATEQASSSRASRARSSWSARAVSIAPSRAAASRP